MEGPVWAGEQSSAAFFALSLFFPIAAHGAANEPDNAPSSPDKEPPAGAMLNWWCSMPPSATGMAGSPPGFRDGTSGSMKMIGYKPSSYFQHEGVPVAVGLVVDNSGSIRQEAMKVACGGFGICEI